MQHVLEQVEDFIGRMEALEGKSVCVVSIQVSNEMYFFFIEITNYYRNKLFAFPFSAFKRTN